MESKLFRLKRIKSQFWRFFPVFFLVVSLFFIIFSLTQRVFVGQMKQGALSVFNPVVSVIKEPVYWVRNGVEKIQDWIQTYQENEHLKEENKELLKWRSLAIQLKEEQKELKKYLNFVAPEKTKHLVAEVAMDEGSAFTRSFIVGAGTNQGVTKGMLAFSPKGLFAQDALLQNQNLCPAT